MQNMYKKTAREIANVANMTWHKKFTLKVYLDGIISQNWFQLKSSVETRKYGSCNS